MKVLTIKQPWASLIIEGYKRFEFRSWKTNYRGELLIHAGKSIDKEAYERLKGYLKEILGKIEEGIALRNMKIFRRTAGNILNLLKKKLDIRSR